MPFSAERIRKTFFDHKFAAFMLYRGSVMQHAVYCIALELHASVGYGAYRHQATSVVAHATGKVLSCNESFT